MIRNILVVCIGNVCRSPIAEGLLRERLLDISVTSAGISALVGEPADISAIAVAAEAGTDISAHRAQQLTAVMTSRADLILVMDDRQKREVIERYPSTFGKIFRLCEQDRIDVPDPYRRPISEFRYSLALIQKGVEAWVPRIKALR
ncbi:protein tyrosine phosphatase [Burkholderia sp. A9]|uniref:low molecular weight protein-tyrosine-phosphatase n=1 Tax=Burkholderia sp. A9 TaxID=1365108 RepID=UPI000573A8EC|nr:low molecular weight protein-tyrosine-phosphatase [Burkholderia sp. A9]KHK57095.1 protein tyrosine phosphatase [Burkholderia sp. A9]